MGGKSSGSGGSQIMAQPSPYETAMAKIANEMFDKTSNLRDYSVRDLENFMGGGSFQGGQTGMGGYPTTNYSYKSQPTGGGTGSLGGGYYYNPATGGYNKVPASNQWYTDESGNFYPESSVTKNPVFNSGSSFTDILNRKTDNYEYTVKNPNYHVTETPSYNDYGQLIGNVVGTDQGTPQLLKVIASQLSPNQGGSGGTGGTSGSFSSPASTLGGLGERYNPFELPAFKPTYDLARKGVEDQYKVGLENILSNTARGGSLNRRLQDLEFNRASDVGSLTSTIAAPIIQDLYNKAYGAAWQTPQTALQGLSSAQTGYGQRLQAANEANKLGAQQQSGTMSSLGTLGGLAGKGVAGLLAGGVTPTAGALTLGSTIGAGAAGLLGLL